MQGHLHKPPIPVNPFKDIETIVESSGARTVSNVLEAHSSLDLLVLVENLHEDKGVENRAMPPVDLIVGLVSENAFSGEEEDQRHHQLEDGLTDDHLPHVQSDQGRRFGFRPSMEDARQWRISGECECGERIHD